MPLKIGCCGFPTSKEKYFENFSVLEIQQTFYQIPEKKTIEKWKKESPEDFEYTLKAWQLITHSPSSPTYRKLRLKIESEKLENYGFFKPTNEIFFSWQETDEITQILKSKVIVFQCPVSFKPEKENLENLKKFF